MRPLKYLIPILILIFSCKEPLRKEEKNINVLKYIIKNQIVENKTILNYIISQEWSNHSIPIRIITKLNDIVLQQIDTTLYNVTPNKNNSTFSQNVLKENYQKTYDSLLITDKLLNSFLQREPKDIIDIKYSDEKSVQENEFLKAQLILIKQNNLLRIIRLAYSPNRCGFDGIPNIGYQIIIRESEGLQTIKFFYNTSKWMKCLPKKLIKITSEDNSPLALKDVQIKGQNLFVVTEKLQKGNYFANIEYIITREEGFETEHELTFPFSVE